MIAMLKNIKILVKVLITIIAIQYVGSSKVLMGSDDSEDENTLKQALYLVKLLKTDYMKSLRANGELEPNTEETNSTCPDEDVLNSTISWENNTTVKSPGAVTVSAVTVPLPTTAQPSLMLSESMVPVVQNSIVALPFPVPPPFPQYAPPMGPPLATLPPPSLVHNVSFKSMPETDALKHPYRYYRRRLMPDYYYYDVLLPRYSSNLELDAPIPRNTTKSKGPFIGKKYSASSFTQFIDTAQFRSPGYRRAGGGAVAVITEIGQTDLETSTLQPLNQSEAGITTSPIMTPSSPTSLTTKSVTTTSAMTMSETTMLPTTSPTITTTQEIESSMLILRGLEHQTVKTTMTHTKIIHVKRGRPKTPAVTEGLSKHMSLKRNKAHHPRTTSEKKTATENVVLSQVATEFVNEFKGTKTEKILASRNNVNKSFSKFKPKAVTPKSTMKIYLPGSTRIQIPLPENNAFCHLYPHSKLCGAGM